MEVEFDIKVTFGSLYDYMFAYTYTSLQGIIGTIAGALFLVEYFFSHNWVYLVFGILVLIYIPGSLYLKAKQQSLSPIYKKPLHYRLSDDGIEVSQGEQEQLVGWEAIWRAGSTIGSILLYTSKRTACIFPKKQLQEQGIMEKVMEVISTHMEPKRVNIK